MNDLTEQDSLELEVANFGPIVEAKIDLRPLTVFVGPSNTGKSYLAILIYALHRFFSRSPDYRILPDIGHRKLPQSTMDVIAKWAQQTFADKRGSGSIVLPHPIADAIRSVLDAQGDQLGYEISRCFGIDEKNQLIRKGSRQGAHVVLRQYAPNGSAPFEHKLTFKAQKTEFGTTIPPKTSLHIELGKRDRWTDRLRYMVEDLVPRVRARERERDFFVWRLIDLLINPALPQLVGPLYRPAFYLPADRTGVMHAHSVVVSAIIGNAPMAGLRPATGTPMLSGVLADFLHRID